MLRYSGMAGGIKRARQLRRDLTFPERLVWSKLRNRQMVGWKFRRQHPVGPYFADFACLDAKLVIELDGDTHSSSEGMRKDAVRDQFLATEGWKVLRIWNRDVLDNLDGVLYTIEGVLRSISEGAH